MSVTPEPAIVAVVSIGGTPVTVFPGGKAGGVITNPADPGDQGLSVAEVLYVNPVGAAALAGNGTTFALYPGQSWTVIPEQTTTTTVNAASSGHKFSAVQWD